MGRICSQCGRTTQESQTTRCVLCKTPFPTESKYGFTTESKYGTRLSSIAKANRESTTDRIVATDGEFQLVCGQCGHTTQETQAACCTLCKTPFPTSKRESLPGPKAEKLIIPDKRNWIVKSIHGRSVGGLVLGPLMVLASLFPLVMTRANMSIAGAKLASLGVFVFLFSLFLFFVTKRRF